MPYTDLSLKLCGKTTLPVLPSQIDLDLSNICNQDCFYCNNRFFRENSSLFQSKEAYFLLLDKLRQWQYSKFNVGRLKTIIFSGGGEPTLHPYFSEIVEKAIDCGFYISIITNGTNINKLIDYLAKDKIEKIAWIGIDIDSADVNTYEKIRKSKTQKTLFYNVIDNVQRAVKAGFIVDIKALLMDLNSNVPELDKLFSLVKNTGARKLHLRPLLDLNANKVFEVDQKTLESLTLLSEKYNVPYSIHLNRTEKRNYKKCHQMFLYPIFAADGNIYVCCENKGDKNFLLGSWIDEDFTKLWFGKRHFDIYNHIDVNSCKPCKPNKINNLIQNDIDNCNKLERLFI